MNIFIIGGSGSGKTTLALFLKEKYGLNHIEASGNLKLDYPINNLESFEDYVYRLSKTSREILLKDPDYFNRAIKEKMLDCNVISGIRNPNDLLKLVNFNNDIVLVLKSDYKSEFEKIGIDSILSILEFSRKFLGLKIVNCELDLNKSISDNFIKNKLNDIIN